MTVGTTKRGSRQTRGRTVRGGLAAVALCTSAIALAASQPQNILPAPAASSAPVAAPTLTPTSAPTPTATATPGAAAAPKIVAQVPLDEPVVNWSASDAKALLGVIEGIDVEGLIPADYQPEKLRSTLASGDSGAISAQASKSFAWLAEDMRDGRTRFDARLQWFVVDTDIETNSTSALMARALQSHDVAGVIGGLQPTVPDYAELKGLLAATPASAKTKRNLIRINMDRWRWLPRQLGKYYLLTNVPEFQLRLTVDNSIIRSYRTIVGKVGKTATPQLAAVVQGVVFNPTWTVPQSIVVGEGMGAKMIGNPAAALRQGYKVTKDKNGMITVVQLPGPTNSLGMVKLDMPNEHAIYIHDTPSRGLFAQPYRALSHGCVRTERAAELGMTMAILGAGLTSDQGVDIVQSGKYTRVPMTKTFPVYIMYFTMARDITGKMGTFTDLYSRDGAVLASFAAPRAPWTGQRQSTEKVVKLDNPL